MQKYLVLFFVVLALVSGCKNKVKKETLWDVYQEPVSPKSLPKDSGAKEIRTLWKKDVGSGSKIGFAILKPAYFEGGIYIASRNGEVSRFQADTGKLIWRKSLGKPVYAAIGVNDGLVAVAHDNGDLTALNSSDGSIDWEVSIKRQISAVPVVGRGRVVIRTSDGLVIGLDNRNGEIVWQVQKTVPGLSMHGDSIPVIVGDAVLIGLSNGKIIANNVISGRDYWETEISYLQGQNEMERLTDSDTPPIVQGATVYTAAYQGNVVAIQLSDATSIWKTSLSTRLPMAVDGEKLYVTGELGDLVALSRQDGSVLWEQRAFRGHGISQPIVLDNRVVIGDSRGRIHTLNPDNGELVETRKIVSGAIVGIVNDGSNFTIFSSAGNIATLSL